MSLEAFNSKEVEVGGQLYHLKKFKAMKGLQIQKQVSESGMITDEGVNIMALDADLIADIVINGCSKGSVNFDIKKFDNEFAGRLTDIYTLTAEIITYNFFPDVADSEEQ